VAALRSMIRTRRNRKQQYFRSGPKGHCTSNGHFDPLVSRLRLPKSTADCRLPIVDLSVWHSGQWTIKNKDWKTERTEHSELSNFKHSFSHHLCNLHQCPTKTNRCRRRLAMLRCFESATCLRSPLSSLHCPLFRERPSENVPVSIFCRLYDSSR